MPTYSFSDFMHYYWRPLQREAVARGVRAPARSKIATATQEYIRPKALRETRAKTTKAKTEMALKDIAARGQRFSERLDFEKRKFGEKLGFEKKQFRRAKKAFPWTMGVRALETGASLAMASKLLKMREAEVAKTNKLLEQLQLNTIRRRRPYGVGPILFNEEII